MGFSEPLLASPDELAERLVQLAESCGAEAQAVAESAGEPIAKSTSEWERLGEQLTDKVKASLAKRIRESQRVRAGETTDFRVPRITSEKVDDRIGTFTIEPLDKGFGYTFGNSLRRVLLSSLGGAAITSVRIEHVAHEFSTVPGVKEDVTDIVLNLKDLVVRMHTDTDEVEAPLVATGPGEIKAKDIDLPSGVEILNPEAPIATLEKKTKLEIYLTIGRGRGYSPAEENKAEDQLIGVIPIDSIFSPIRRAAYSVATARVGQRTDFDKLTLELETDGSTEPGDALREASEILIKSLAIFADPDRYESPEAGGPSSIRGYEAEGLSTTETFSDTFEETLIEELELGLRSYNGLKRAGVQTVGDLVRKTRSELNAIPNFGPKSLEEVLDTLHSQGFDVSEA